MKRERSQRLLLSLFGLAALCMVMATAHRLIRHDLMPMWTVCCDALDLLPAKVVLFWRPAIVRSLTAATLVAGLAVLAQRAWRTSRFVATLKPAITSYRPAKLTHLCAELGLPAPIVVLAIPAPLAFCYGLFRPRICLSTGLVEALTDKELKAVLLHEEYHRRHYDPLRTFLADVLAVMFFFLPAVAEWRDFFLASTELAADRYATHLAGRSFLAGALHKLLAQPRVVSLPAGIGGITNLSATDARLAQLL
ncbi:MAG: M56 family metallopeptidase, partial [Chloroflexi bacterium]|nr:M56 family metallopeptidase [Chloroflexota bacterium]